MDFLSVKKKEEEESTLILDQDSSLQVFSPFSENSLSATYIVYSLDTF